MRPLFFVFFILLILPAAIGAGVGVVPGRITPDEEGKAGFTVINPNKETITFSLTEGSFVCEPSKGEIEGGGKSKIGCIASGAATAEETILVETTTKGEDGSVGILPAVAVSVTWSESGGEYHESSEEYSDEEPKTAAKPVVTTGNAKNNTGEEGSGHTPTENNIWWNEMRGELALIITLSAAIIAVLAYSEIKKRKNPEKKEEKLTGSGASCSQDAPSGQSSASTAASHDLPLIPP
jgi:hypothetical protein